MAELSRNPKLPAEDRERLEVAQSRYDQWIAEMSTAPGVGDAKVVALAEALNRYKRAVEVDLIWDSEADFLFRQRGQLKLDNSIIEEFLPWLVDPAIISELGNVECSAGPAGAFAAAYFATTLTAVDTHPHLRVRTKDQDFTLSRSAFLRASFDSTFPASSTDTVAIWLAYLAAECKTNLDKTMFQEATATAHDLKVAMPGARYYLLCEFLDMRPLSTVGTSIDEVLILRGKRLASNKRSEYSTAKTRQARRDEYIDFLDAHPLRSSVVIRFVEHLRALVSHVDLDEGDVVQKGYF